MQAQIDETLEEIAPRSILELLALPLDDEHKIRREEGLHGIRNILWTVGVGGATVVSGGFTREDIMKKAFLRMTALEQVCHKLISDCSNCFKRAYMTTLVVSVL